MTQPTPGQEPTTNDSTEQAESPIEQANANKDTASQAPAETEQNTAAEAPAPEAPVEAPAEALAPDAETPVEEAPAEPVAPEQAASSGGTAAEAPSEQVSTSEEPAAEAPAGPTATEAKPAAPVAEKADEAAESPAEKPAEPAAPAGPPAVPHGVAGKPRPTPSPAPGRPTPKPPKSGPKPPPVPHKPASKPAVVPPTPPIDPKAASEAAAWGRVDDEGNVYLRASGDGGERLVGQYAIGDSKDDALSVYVRRYLDLVAQASLLESRLEIVNPQEIIPGLKTLDEALVEPAVVGDVDALRARVEAIRERLKVRQAEFDEERKVAKLQALADRTSIIERAEAIAAQDPDKTHWRDSRNELSSLLEQWKRAQKAGPRIDRTAEEGLWKRFSRARTEFDRHRRQHFSKVEANRNEVTARKEALIKRAEEMSSSTDWGATSAAYRDLLEEWKAAGRITRKEDDKLWARFRAAQQVFFDARQADRDSINSEQNENLAAKLALIKEAEAILPIKDIQVAKNKLHDIQDRWEQIGFVPRKDISRTEGRLRDVESAVRAAEDEQWRKSDPSKIERATGFAAQLEDAIAKHEQELADAQAKGDEKAAQRAQEALDARRAWLQQLK